MDAPGVEARIGWRPIAWVPAGLAVASVVLSPGDGLGAWFAFAVAVVAVAVTLTLTDRPLALGAITLLGAIALKDGLLVVVPASVGVFHVVLAGTVLAVAFDQLRGSLNGDAGGPVGGARIRLTPLEWALLTPALAGLWSLPLSLDAPATALYAARLLMLWVAALIVSRGLRGPALRRRGLAVFVLGAAALAAVAFMQWLAPELSLGGLRLMSAGGGTEFRPAAFYMDPNFMAAHLVLAGLAAIALAPGSARPRSWSWLVAAAALFGVVAIAYSRSAWLALAAGLVVLAVLSGRRLRLAIGAIVVVAVIAGSVAVGPQALFGRLVSVGETGAGSSNEQRILMIRSSGAMIADRPVFGTGLEGFDDAYREYLLPGADPTLNHPHQVPLALLVETGLGGIAALLALLAAGGTAMWRVVRARDRGADAAIIAGLVGLAVASLFQFVLYFEPAWLFAGLLASAAYCRRRRDASGSAHA